MYQSSFDILQPVYANKSFLYTHILCYFYSDKLFPALGFGARFPDQSVQHEFALVSFHFVTEYFSEFLNNVLLKL